MFTDVTLVCKDEKPLAAHNGILTLTSPFFMNILKRTTILVHLQSSHSPLHCNLSVTWEGFQEMALHTLCWTKLALPVHDLAHLDNDQVEAHFPLHNVWKDHLRPRTCDRSAQEHSCRFSTRLYVVWKHLMVPQPNNRTHNICPCFALPTRWQKVELKIV